MEETTISQMLEAITGEYIGDKNSLTIWAPNLAGKIAIAKVNFDPKTRKWNLQYNDSAPQGVVDEFKRSTPQEHIKAMIRMASTGDYNGNDGKYDFTYEGGTLKSSIPD